MVIHDLSVADPFAASFWPCELLIWNKVMRLCTSWGVICCIQETCPSIALWYLVVVWSCCIQILTLNNC
jgi:hypothetical protein